MDEQTLKQIEEAAEKGAEKGARHASKGLSRIGLIGNLLSIIIILFVSISLYNSLHNSPATALNPEAEQHDLILEDNGLFGYTAADFEEAILGDSSKLKKLEVYSINISDLATITKAGLLNIAAFSKEQMITYNGTATYTVNLSKLTKNSLVYDESAKTFTIFIPHAVQENINIPRSEIKYGEVKKGILTFGNLNLTPEEINAVEEEAVEKMKQKLINDGVSDDADRFAKMSVWELYQPVISSIAPDVTLIVEIK